MRDLRAEDGTIWQEAESRYVLDGVERVPLLPQAHMVALAPPADPREPVYVYVEWPNGEVERPVPGSAVWRAVLDGYLAGPPGTSFADSQVRMVVRANRERFGSLQQWFDWRDEHRRPLHAPAPKTAHWLPWMRVRWPW